MSKPLTVKFLIRKLKGKMLIRHVNNNTFDNRIQNLQRVSAQNAFVHKDWTVDVVLYLSEEEFEFWTTQRDSWNGNLAIFK